MGQSLRNARYTSRIIKAGALLPDTKLLLETWDEDSDVQSNLDRVRQENLFGKASRARVEDILLVFRQRYLKDPKVLKALVVMARSGVPSESLDRILYFQAARFDPLLHDLVTELLHDWSGRSDREVYPWKVQSWVAEQVEAGRPSALGPRRCSAGLPKVCSLPCATSGSSRAA